MLVQDMQRHVSDDLLGAAMSTTRAAEGVAWVRGWDDYSKQRQQSSGAQAAVVPSDSTLNKAQQ